MTDYACATCGHHEHDCECHRIKSRREMTVEEECRAFCAWKGGGTCLADDCPRRTTNEATGDKS